MICFELVVAGRADPHAHAVVGQYFQRLDVVDRSCPPSPSARRRSCCRSSRRGCSGRGLRDRGRKSVDASQRRRAGDRARLRAARAPGVGRDPLPESPPCTSKNRGPRQRCSTARPGKFRRRGTGWARHARAQSTIVGDNIVHTSRNHDADGNLAVAGTIRRVESATAVIEADFAADIAQQRSSKALSIYCGRLGGVCELSESHRTWLAPSSIPRPPLHFHSHSRY